MLDREVVERIERAIAEAMRLRAELSGVRITSGNVESASRLSDEYANACCELLGDDGAAISELLRVYRLWLDGPRVEITACNQVEGARDFDYGDMTSAVGQFDIGDFVRLVRDGDSGEG